MRSAYFETVRDTGRWHTLQNFSIYYQNHSDESFAFSYAVVRRMSDFTFRLVSLCSSW